MLKFVLYLAASAAALYLLLFAKSWARSRRGLAPGTSRPGYLVGLTFAGLYYYGLPFWLWRFGWWATLKIFLFCFGSGAVITLALRWLGADIEGIGGAIFIGQIVQVPIRACVGGWVARNDARLVELTSARRAEARAARASPQDTA